MERRKTAQASLTAEEREGQALFGKMASARENERGTLLVAACQHALNDAVAKLGEIKAADVPAIYKERADWFSKNLAALATDLNADLKKGILDWEEVSKLSDYKELRWLVGFWAGAKYQQFEGLDNAGRSKTEMLPIQIVPPWSSMALSFTAGISLLTFPKVISVSQKMAEEFKDDAAFAFSTGMHEGKHVQPILQNPKIMETVVNHASGADSSLMPITTDNPVLGTDPIGRLRDAIDRLARASARFHSATFNEMGVALGTAYFPKKAQDMENLVEGARDYTHLLDMFYRKVLGGRNSDQLKTYSFLTPAVLSTEYFATACAPWLGPFFNKNGIHPKIFSVEGKIDMADSTSYIWSLVDVNVALFAKGAGIIVPQNGTVDFRISTVDRVWSKTVPVPKGVSMPVMTEVEKREAVEKLTASFLPEDAKQRELIIGKFVKVIDGVCKRMAELRSGSTDEGTIFLLAFYEKMNEIFGTPNSLLNDNWGATEFVSGKKGRSV